MASALNSLAAVTIQDFVNEACGIQLKDSKGAFWAKCISIGYGAISFVLVSDSLIDTKYGALQTLHDQFRLG